MSTRENAPPPPDWSPEPRPNPFDVAETPQHHVFIRGCDDVALADVELDALGTE